MKKKTKKKPPPLTEAEKLVRAMTAEVSSLRIEVSQLRHMLSMLKGEISEHTHGAAGSVVKLLLQQRDEARSELFRHQNAELVTVAQRRDDAELSQLRRELAELRAGDAAAPVNGGGS